MLAHYRHPLVKFVTVWSRHADNDENNSKIELLRQEVSHWKMRWIRLIFILIYNVFYREDGTRKVARKGLLFFFLIVCLFIVFYFKLLSKYLGFP